MPPKQPPKQHLLFIEFGPAEGRPLAPAKPVPVAFKERDVAQVWTLFRHTDPDEPPLLPFQPVHRVNAFAEDLIHDWNIDHLGRFRYASRVTDQPVWVLVVMKGAK